MRKVLITGADGFIGRHLVNEYLKCGDTYVIAIMSPRHSGGLSQVKHKNLYVTAIDLNQVLYHVDEFPDDIDTMFHFAWRGVKPELRNNLEVQMSNLVMTINCMKLAIQKHIKKMIFPGSTNEYIYYGKPLNKDAVPSPCNAYGAAKIALRYLCYDYSTRNDIEFIYSIIAGIYAADRKDSNVIYYTIEKLLKGEKPSLSECKQLWDYVHIDDVVDALIAIGDKGKDGGVYGIGHGDNWELKNYINIIHDIINPDIPLGYGEVPYTSDKLPSSCIDLTDIEKDTGWVPKIEYKDGIKTVIEKVKEDLLSETK